MLQLPLRCLFCASRNFRISVRSLGNASTELRSRENAATQFNSKLPHIYCKTWTKSELIQHMKDNVVYETDDYIATSIPQGIALNKNTLRLDSVDFLTCDSNLNEILKDLPTAFGAESIFLTCFPTRNASGLVILSKKKEAHRRLKNCIKFNQFKDYIFNYLAVVVGCPEQTITQTFGMQLFKVEDKFGTEVLQKWKDTDRISKISYHHKVLSSSEHVSLVKIEVSNDLHECVRHILAKICSTPALGDSYNYVNIKSNFLGVPLQVDPSLTKCSDSVKLNPDLLTKLQLKSDSQKLIPIHTHCLRKSSYVLASIGSKLEEKVLKECFEKSNGN